MVDQNGQLYTIEGIAAGLLMIFTAYLVMSTTTIYTPGDTHITDMQLEQLGTDALRVMNTPVNGLQSESPLQIIVEQNDGATFNTMFTNLVNNRTGSATDNLHYSATVTYYNITGQTTGSIPLESNRNLTGVEHPVRVTGWVIVNKLENGPFPGDPNPPNNPRAALVEVLLWRD
jgi:hypothetical protein